MCIRQHTSGNAATATSCRPNAIGEWTRMSRDLWIITNDIILCLVDMTDKRQATNALIARSSLWLFATMNTIDQRSHIRDSSHTHIRGKSIAWFVWITTMNWVLYAAADRRCWVERWNLRKNYPVICEAHTSWAAAKRRCLRTDMLVSYERKQIRSIEYGLGW